MHGLRERIKSTFAASVFFLALVTCMSCVKPDSFSSEPSSSSDELFPAYAYNTEAAVLQSSTRAAVSENGYYFMANRILYYYDIGNETMFPLCTKEACQHNGKDCDAFIFGFEENDPDWLTNCMLYRMISYQGNLYMFSQKTDTSVILYRYSKEFSRQEKIAQLTDGSATPRSLCQDVRSFLFRDGYLYYLTYTDPFLGQYGMTEHDSEYTIHKICLEKDSKPKDLFSFHYNRDPLGAHDIQLTAIGKDIYCVIASQMFYLDTETPVRQYVYRYNENDETTLLWSYEGREKVNLFGAPGEGPAAACYSSCIGKNEVFFYLTEVEDVRGECTTVSCIDLRSEESKVLYHTPYQWISQLRSDGENCYFFEHGGGKSYLTAIDTEGALLRRYEIPYTDEWQKAMREQGISQDAIPIGDLRLLIADQRYLAISSMNTPECYRDLSAIADVPVINGVMDCTNGIGLIRTDDFIAGKEIKVIQLLSLLED